jgi:hypothetical protein
MEWKLECSYMVRKSYKINELHKTVLANSLVQVIVGF